MTNLNLRIGAHALFGTNISDRRARGARVLRALSLLLGLLVVGGGCEAGQDPPSGSPAVTAADASSASMRQEESRMWMTVGKRRFAVTVTDNAAARAFAAQLPLTLDMSELNGNEKHADLPKPLPANASRPGTIGKWRSHAVWRGHPGGLLHDVSIVVLVHPPGSGGRPFRPATGARAARCSSAIFQGLVFRVMREVSGFSSKQRGGPTEPVGQQGGPS